MTGARDQWSGTMQLVLAETEGDCGALGELPYDIDASKLADFTCDVPERAVAECSVRETLKCQREADLSFDIALSLEFDGTWWRGIATVQGQSAAMECSSTYNVVAVP